MFPRKRKKVEATRSLSEKQGTKSPFKRQKKENRDKENLQRICVIRTYIVGIQHYRGKNSVSTGSRIWLRRNPNNYEDSNAIECCPRPSCPEWEIVGHICKELAVPLARLLDDGLVYVEGEIVFDAEASTDYLSVKPVRINLSGNYTRKDEIIRKLKRYQFYDVESHYKTAPMKTRDVDGQKKFMAYDIGEVTSLESNELGLQDMELKHLLVLFALLMEENNQFSLESDDWMKTLNRVNVDFQQPEKPDYILRKTLESEKLENYIFFKNQKLAFKSTQIPGKVIQFITTKENYVEYFVQHASSKGLREYCVTSSQSVSKPAFVLNSDQLRKLAERMKYDILSHPVIKDKSIHKTVSETLKIPEVILGWNEDGKNAFVQSLQEGTEDIFHARWMILGCAGVGKTTLLKKIRGLSMDEVLHTVPTEGVEIHNRIFEVTGNSLHDVTGENISPVGITLNQSTRDPINKDEILQNTPSSKSKPKAKNIVMYSKNTKQRSIPATSDDENTPVLSEARPAAGPNSFKEKETPASYQLTSYSEVDSDPLHKLLPFLSNKIKHSNRKTLDILDFAGESDYYASHQIFLRPQAGFILVLNMAERFVDIPSKTIGNSMMFHGWKNKDFLKYWMSSIHKNSPKAPVVLVATHAEGKTKQDIEEYFVEVWNIIDSEKLKGHLNEDRKFTVTLNDDRNIAELKNCLAKESVFLAIWGQKIPQKWSLCEKFLQDLKESVKIISLRDISSVLHTKLEKLQIDGKQLIWMLKFYHDIGEIIHFADKGLGNFVILDINFFLELFKCIIKTDVQFRGKIARRFGNKWKRYTVNGLLDEEMCIEILKEVHDLKEEDKEMLFQYMSHIGLMVDITDAALVRKTWYVPYMNNSRFPSENFKDYERSSIYCFVADFMPEILYYRLVSKVVADHSLGEIVSNGDQKCIYQTVCALYHHEDTHIVLVGRCETSIQVQVLSKTDLDKNISREILKKVSKEVEEMKTIFGLNIEFTEGFLCDRSSITDHFLLKGISKERLLKAYEKNDIFLCKKCAVDQPHMINSKALLSYWIDVNETMEDGDMKRKRGLYLKLYLIAMKTKTKFQAIELSIKLLEDDNIMESGVIRDLEREVFEVLVKWMELNPDIPYMEKLTEVFHEIGRSDIAENINHFELTDFVYYPVASPQLGIRRKDVKMIVEETAAAYHKMGIFLGLSPQQLRNIDMNHPKCVQTKMQHVLEFRTVNRQELVNSLHFVGRVDVIKRLTTLWNKS